MLRSAVSKAMWVGRATVFLVGLAVIVALVLGVASTALGANGKPFLLGKAANGASKVTGLIGKVATGSALVVKNPSGGSALGLSVGDPAADPASKSVAPMEVDSQEVVTNLNADQLDGLDSSALKARATPTYMVRQPLDGVANEIRGGRVDCDSGDEVLAGGYDALSSGAQVVSSVPQAASSSDGGSWFIGLRSGSEAGSVGMLVQCYDYPPAHGATP